ncbi:hypothetical protein G3578_10340 [Brevibacillus sp. SYP-B805]|uniref:phosphodiester glycosidase family protein n=1 Tax=Brevibacillus sp. SYP-B805 TaxID=1578199 RepID=UPI0013EBAF18|nr:phosphodiester glycosidase family protein [Brevibacillus sp. SYP-B805]NGQ95552.1 hypothetical protein [Brevibacillus sp. SYP-B805]
MNSRRRALSLITASVLAWGAFFPAAANVAYARMETSALALSWQTPIGEGTMLQKYTKSYGDQQVSIMVTKVDLNNPYVEVKPVYGTNQKLTERQTVTQMARETGAIAAVNADFFNMSKRGAPFGIVMRDRELVSSMGLISYWYSLGLTSDKTALIEHFGFSGQVTAPNGTSFPLQGVNKEEYNPSEGRKSHLNQLNLYTPRFGKTSLGAIPGYQNVVEVVFVNNVATEVRVNQPGAVIPENGYVLWGHGPAATFLLQNFPVGAAAQISYQTTPTNKDWTQAVGGSVLLVDQGRALTSFATDSYIKQINARTAVGVTQDGKTLFLVTVDGSKPVYLDEMADIMAELGSWRAINLDGGGSTTHAARMLGETEAKLINQPSGGAERRVPTGIAVYNTAPPGVLAGFNIVGPAEVLIGQTVKYDVKAWDNHYLPYSLKASDVTWQAGQSDSGSFEQESFTATRSGTATIIAEAAGIRQQRDIHVISGQEVAQLLVSPSPINLAQGQVLTLDIKVKTKKGQLIAATPRSVQLYTDSPVVTTNDQLQLIAGEQAGTANLTVTYDGVSTTVPIIVGQVEIPWLTFDNQTSMSHVGYPASLSNYGSFTAVSAGGGEPVFRTRKSAKLTYNLSGAPETDVRIAYGRVGAKPETIPGKPIGIGLWVYGDNSKHWLRSEIVDAKGKLVYVDLAKEIDWTGWKQVKGYFPAGLTYPLQLKSIYIVAPAESSNDPHDQGVLYFDEVSLLLPSNAATEPKGREVTPGAPGTLSLGQELDLGYSLQQTASFLQKARLDVKSIVPQPLPGYVPADYAFTLQGAVLKPGQPDQLSTKPVTVTLKPKKWIKGKGVGLLYINEANHTLDPLLGEVDANGNWVYQLNAYGTYVPYYLDPPAGVPFVDIINHPAREEITALAKKGLVKGLDTNLFGPEVPLTRAQFVTLLARAFQWKLPDKPKLNFKDAIPAYAQGAVQVALSKGLVKGYPDKTFRPNQSVTRAEAALILDRILNKKAQPSKPLADQKSLPKWAAPAIANMVGLGLIDPEAGRFNPNQPMTRAVCVVALYRILEKQ